MLTRVLAETARMASSGSRLVPFCPSYSTAIHGMNCGMQYRTELFRERHSACQFQAALGASVEVCPHSCSAQAFTDNTDVESVRKVIVETYLQLLTCTCLLSKSRTAACHQDVDRHQQRDQKRFDWDAGRLLRSSASCAATGGQPRGQSSTAHELSQHVCSFEFVKPRC